MIKKLLKNILLALLVAAVVVSCDAMQTTTSFSVPESVHFEVVKVKGRCFCLCKKPLTGVSITCGVPFVMKFLESNRYDVARAIKVVSKKDLGLFVAVLNGQLNDLFPYEWITLRVNTASIGDNDKLIIYAHKAMTHQEQLDFSSLDTDAKLKFLFQPCDPSVSSDGNIRLALALYNTLKILEPSEASTAKKPRRVLRRNCPGLVKSVEPAVMFSPYQDLEAYLSNVVSKYPYHLTQRGNVDVEQFLACIIERSQPLYINSAWLLQHLDVFTCVFNLKLAAFSNPNFLRVEVDSTDRSRWNIVMMTEVNLDEKDAYDQLLSFDAKLDFLFNHEDCYVLLGDVIKESLINALEMVNSDRKKVSA